MGVMAEGAHGEMMSDLIVPVKTIWLSCQIEGARYLCCILYNNLEPRQHWYHKIIIIITSKW